MSDLDTSIAFYEKQGNCLLIPGVPYLGIGKDSRAEIPASQSKALGVPADTTARACIMQLDDGFPSIDLTGYAADSPQAAAANGAPGNVRLCPGTHSLAQDCELLKSNGIEFMSEPTEFVGGAGRYSDLS